MVILDRFLLRAPAATYAWTCPWFVVIVVLGIPAILLGILSGETVGWADAAVTIVLLAYLSSTRRRPGGESC